MKIAMKYPSNIMKIIMNIPGNIMKITMIYPRQYYENHNDISQAIL